MRVSILDSIHDSRFLRELRIENRESKTSYRESSRESSLTGQKTKDSPMTDFSNFTILRYGYIPTSDCMRETRPIQIIKQMFLQGHLYQASFPQLKFQIPAPNANKQHVYFVTSNDSGLIRPLGLIKISCNIHVRP